MLLQIQEPNYRGKVSAIGIDLGTTHSVVSFFDQDADLVFLPLIPSVVAYDEQGVCAVGEQARHLLKSAPERVVSSIKRLMGRGTEDPAARTFSHPVIANAQGIHITVCGHLLSPVEIVAEILKHIKQLVKDKLGYFVDEVVITVPAYFDEAARSATRDSARLAGFSVLRLLNEPTAAALAYGSDQGKEGVYGVYDLGGGTFDFSLLKMEKGIFKVLSTCGDLCLGGDDFDYALAGFCLKNNFEKASLSERKKNLETLRQAKEDLTQMPYTTCVLQGHPHRISRETFEGLIHPFIQRTLFLAAQALHEGGVEKKQLKGIIFVGGSTRIPAVYETVKDFFQKPPLTHLNPDYGVCFGAGVQAKALTQGAQHLLLDVTPLSLGLETIGGIVESLIPRNTPIPVQVTQEFTTFQEGQKAIKIHVVQGEHEEVSACRSLGQFELQGIPDLPAGVARVAVTFTVDTDGLLTVCAQETRTQTMQSLQVKPAYGLSEKDILALIYAPQQGQEKDAHYPLFLKKEKEAILSLEEVNALLKTCVDLFDCSERDVLERACTQLQNVLLQKNFPVLCAALDQFIATCLPFVQRYFQQKTLKTEI